MPTLQSIRPQALDSAAHRPLRPLGSDFAPQSHVYLFYIPVVLVFSAIGIWIMPSDGSFVFGTLVGGLTGLYILLDIVFRDTPLRFTTVYAMTLLVAYNLGSFNSWLTLSRGGLTLAEFFSRDPAQLARAVAACMAVCAVLLVTGQIFEPPLFGREFRLNFDSALPIGLVSCVLLAFGYATGQLGYMGINTNGGHVSPAADLILWWSIPAFAYAVCATLNAAGPTRWALAACALVQGLAIVPFGRRTFAFSLLLALLGMRLGEFRLRMPWFKKLFLGAFAIAVVLTASLAFLYLRVAGYQQKGQTTSTRTRISLAVDTASRVSPEELLDVMGKDASNRFMIGFFSDLLDASQRSKPLLGNDILYNMQLIVPSVISADKFGIAQYDEEGMANMQWGFSYIDEGNSLLTAGAADFGLIGVLLYPLLILLLMRVTLEWIQMAVPAVAAAIIALSFISEVLKAEDVPVAYFAQIRNALILGVLFYFFSKLPRFRLRRAS